MKKCVKILFPAVLSDSFLHGSVKEAAIKFTIEGSARVLFAEKKIELLLCGKKDNIDNFIDLLHRELLKVNVHEIEVEPFIKVKDYRGIFRVID